MTTRAATRPRKLARYGIRGLAHFGALICLAACSSLEVTTDYDGDTRFDAYATWAFMPPEPAVTDTAPDVPPDDSAPFGDASLAEWNGLLAQRLERAVVAAMQARGVAAAASVDEADLLVRFAVNIERRLTVDKSSYGPARGPYAYGSRSGSGSARRDHTTVREYEQGTLVLDLFDRASGELVWRGWTQSRVNRKGTPADREARVRDAVNAILAEYPPQP